MFSYVFLHYQANDAHLYDYIIYWIKNLLIHM